MFKRFVKLLSFFVFSCLYLTSVNSLANDFNHLDDLVVKQLIVGKESVYIGFTELPEGCKGSYKGFHAELSKKSANFEAVYIKLVRARSNKTPVSVDFYIRGDCTKESGEDSLMLIEKITF